MPRSKQNNDGTITVMDGDRNRDFHYLHIIPGENGFDVKGYDEYPKGSVLEGQTRINFLDHFDTLEEAEAIYPHAAMSNQMLEPVNTFDDLPDTPDDGYYCKSPDDY